MYKTLVYFRIEELLHATFRSTCSAAWQNFVSSCLQSINLRVQCFWRRWTICTYSATPLSKNCFNASLVFIPGTFGDDILRT